MNFSKLEVVTILLIVFAIIIYVDKQKDKPTVTVTFEAVKETEQAPKAVIKVTPVASTEGNKGSFKGNYIKGDGSPSRPKKWRR